MSGGASYRMADLTPNKTMVDQGLAILLPPFADAVVRVLEKEYGDSWWRDRVQGNRGIRFLENPASDSREDRVGVLQMSHCCELVFSDRMVFTNAWGRGHIGLCGIVHEARNRSAHRSVSESDLTAGDAEYYVHAMLRLAREIRADSGTCNSLERLHEVLWQGGTIGYAPVRYRCEGAEPRVSEVLGREGLPAPASASVARWFDDDALRERVLQAMALIPPEAVAAEMYGRLQSEVGTSDYGVRVHVFPETADDVPDSPELKIVVLPPIGGASPEERADIIMATCRGTPRKYRNMLVFVFAEEVPGRLFERRASEYLALCKLSEADPDDVGLSRFAEEADVDLRGRTKAAFSNVMAPVGGWERYGLQYRRLRTAGGNVVATALEALADAGLLYVAMGHGGRRGTWIFEVAAMGGLSGWCLRISDLWRAVCTDCRLPRVESRGALLNEVWRAVREGSCGYLEQDDTPDPEAVRRMLIGVELPVVSMDAFVVDPRAAIELGWVPKYEFVLVEGGEIDFEGGAGDDRRERCPGDAVQGRSGGGAGGHQAPDGVVRLRRPQKERRWGPHGAGPVGQADQEVAAS